MHPMWRRAVSGLPSPFTSYRKRLYGAGHAAVPAPASPIASPAPVLVSRLFQPSNLWDMGPHEGATEPSCRSHRLMQQAGLIHPGSPGCFFYLPTGLRAMEKLVRLIDQEMQAVGGQKLDMPTLSSAELWRRSGRWELMGKELFRLADRHQAQYCLGPTHEEAVTALLAHQASLSYRQLPLLLYQITRKFRDEPKPRSGLLRGREFYMKDMYSFDVSAEAAQLTYRAVCAAYARLFSRLGLRCLQVQAHTGNIGGTLSHEFQLPADVGEDRLLVCGACSFSANVETLPPDSAECPQCHSHTLAESRGIEVGHTFYLGRKYSSIFNATFSDTQGKPVVMEMGCFGLGVSRILAAALEVLSTEESLRWPGLLAPYQVCVLPPKRGSRGVEQASSLAQELVGAMGAIPGLRGEVVVDDRTQLTIGRRLKDALRLGYPYVVVVGQGALEPTPRVEVVCQQSGETVFLSQDALLELLGGVETL